VVDVEELQSRHGELTVALWNDVGLTRPWNDPLHDFDRAVTGATSAMLGLLEGDELVGSAMVGHDGHRGWVHYVAVARARQRQGLGARLMRAA
jgi:ribosomal protein S18 acetylase RimI-like enzyme